LCLIPLFTRRQDADLQWHARNGLALFLAETAIILVLGVLAMPLLLVFHGRGFFFLTTLFFLFWAGVLALHVSCVLQALQGRRFVVPLLSRLAERI